MTALLAGTAAGESLEGLRLSGYGTVGYVKDNRSDIAAIRDISQQPDDFSKAESWKRDTRIGLQAEYHVTPDFDLVGQIVARDQIVQDLDHSVELGYIGWKPTADIDLRLGRLGYDAFLMSDTRNIGYAYPWVRPFTEYYGWIPIFSVDGADATYTITRNDGHWYLKAQTGRTKVSIPVGTGILSFRGKDLLNLAVTRHSGPWQLKAGLSYFKNINEVSPGNLSALQDGLAAIAEATAGTAPAISAEAMELGRHLSFKDLRVTLATIGASYDDGKWVGQTEIARTRTNHDIAPHGTMGYAAIGRRVGHWTPFMALSASRPANGLRTAGTDWNVIGQGSTQAAALRTLNSTRINQTTWSLGTRWDFSSQAALKLQADTCRITANGYGLHYRDPALENQSSRLSQFTTTLDFVF